MSEEQKKEAIVTEATKEGTEAQKAKKNKKINVMTLKEIEQAIEKTNKNQNGLFSKYALELIKRRDFLAKTKK